MRLELLDYLRHLLAHSIVFGRIQLLFSCREVIAGLGELGSKSHQFMPCLCPQLPVWGVTGLGASLGSPSFHLHAPLGSLGSFLTFKIFPPARANPRSSPPPFWGHFFPRPFLLFVNPFFFSTSHSLWHPKPPVSLIKQSVCKSTTPDQLPNWWFSLMSFY